MGADHRVFSRLNLPENHTHLSWIENEPDETLESYALRMADKITHKNPILIGLSFGGIVAQEIAAIRPVEKIVLISTIKSQMEKPWYFKLASRLRLIDMIPEILLKSPNTFVYFAFSLQTREEKRMLKQCIEQSSPAHLKWAMKQVVDWPSTVHKTPTFHIHSTRDRIFPIKTINFDALINGGHFAIYTNADELNEVLRDEFE